jgi:hypothetical protein
MFPSSSFGFNSNHEQFNEDNTPIMPSSTSLNNNNNNIQSMTIIDDQQDESTNEGEDAFHRKFPLLSYLSMFIGIKVQTLL